MTSKGTQSDEVFIASRMNNALGILYTLNVWENFETIGKKKKNLKNTFLPLHKPLGTLSIWTYQLKNLEQRD